MHIVEDLRIVQGQPNSNGWRELTLGRIDPYYGDLPNRIGESLLNLVHLTDTHICDAQSPARVEFLDRYADPHHPIAPLVDSLVGTYRAHESLTTQVLDSMLQRIARINRAPITKKGIDAVIFTGDLIDNAQCNEIDWFTRLLNGGLVKPDSGTGREWQGVGGAANYSEHYWNPHGTPRGERDDFPRAKYGFPVIPEFLDAARASFFGAGSPLPWYAVHGNHDALLQGTVPPNPELLEMAVGSRKLSEISDTEALSVLRQISEVGPADYPSEREAQWYPIDPDMQRTFLKSTDFYGQLLRNGSTHGGIPLQNSERRFWTLRLPRIRLISLDTVNPHGGWQGSLDQEQLNWLETQLLDDRSTPTVILSHHPVQDLVNTYHPADAQPRVGRDRVIDILLRFTNVILWLAGHTHRNRISFKGRDQKGFWQIETSSLIDWPQQGRLIEIFQGDPGEITIATTMIDHCGSTSPNPSKLQLDDVHELAGMSRLLAANDWQRREGKFSISLNEGDIRDRNRFITVETALK